MRLADALASVARELCELVGGDACAISRLLGDVLILFTEHAPRGTLQLGQGYLVSDYPRTEDVLRRGVAYRMTLDDPGVDASESSVVRQLGFAGLMLLALGDPPAPWGLVEIYRAKPGPFTDGDVLAARRLLADTAARFALS
jgi:transcriptional regulator with GAF, ATPase, and Fis domain